MAEIIDKKGESMQVTPIPEKGKKGGVRAGAGMKKGQLTSETQLRRKALRNYRVRVTRLTDKLLNAQLSLALGVAYLIRVDVINKGKKNEYKKHVVVDDPKEIVDYFNEDVDSDQYYYISTEKPDVRALWDILERTYGKPEQNIDMTSKGGEIKIVLGAGSSQEETDESEHNDRNT